MGCKIFQRCTSIENSTTLLQVFVPTYSGSEMKMLSISDMEDYEKLPVTKWKIKQPNLHDERRENPMTSAG